MNFPKSGWIMAAATAASALILVGPAPTASAYVGGPTVLYTGSAGPVMGCPHTVAASVPDPSANATEIWVDGAMLTPVVPDLAPGAGPNGVRVTWVPTRLGRYTLEVVYSPAGGPQERGRLDIDVWRVGINAGSSCIANGFPLPIDPNTGTLAQFM